MMAPVFSIIMPAYNAEKNIEESIDSVLKQTYRDFELIIVDDSSIDDTWVIIEKYLKIDKRIKAYRSEINRGVAMSRNKAMTISVGRYITFLDSDDLWMPDKLNKQYQAFSIGADLVFSWYVRFIDKTSDAEKLVVAPKEASYKTLLSGNYIGNLTGAYDRNRFGLVVQKEIGHEDYLMWLQIAKKSKKSIGIQEVLAKYRVSANSVSSNKLKSFMWTWSIYRNHLNLGMEKSFYRVLCYCFNALKKRVL